MTLIQVSDELWSVCIPVTDEHFEQYKEWLVKNKKTYPGSDIVWEFFKEFLPERYKTKSALATYVGAVSEIQGMTKKFSKLASELAKMRTEQEEDDQAKADEGQYGRNP